MKRLTLLTALMLATVALFAAGQREGGDFNYNDITTLQIEAGTFAVDIQASRGRQVSMEIENYPDDYTVFHSVNGDTVRVWVEKNFSLFSGPHRGRLVFTIPSSLDIDVDNSTGSVSISGIDGDLRVQTSTGSIRFEETRGTISARSTTGSIDVRRSTGRIDLDSTTGSIEVVGFDGPIVANSSTGRQSYDDVDGDVDARSTTGRIELSGVTGQLRIRTSTGNQEGTEVTLTGDSSFEASTGSIRIDLVNDVNAVEFDLRSTTGSLEVGRERSQRRLFLGSTGIRVEATTSTGSQRFY